MIQIRPLTPDELPLCYELGEKFVSEGEVSGGFRESAFQAMWTHFLASGLGAIFAAFEGPEMVGAIGAIASPNPNNGELETMEMFWYVAPERRNGGMLAIRLLKSYDAWAKRVGAKRQRIALLLNLQPKKLSHLYQRLGYKAVEVHYEREVD